VVVDAGFVLWYGKRKKESYQKLIEASRHVPLALVRVRVRMKVVEEKEGSSSANAIPQITSWETLGNF
jgi:hypothetical protein